MSCNYCAIASATPASAVGTPGAGVEANWSAHRVHPRRCDQCGAFLRADGGCTKCEGGGTSVSSDARALDAEKRLAAALVALTTALFGEGTTIYHHHPSHQALLTKARTMAAGGGNGPPRGELREIVESKLEELGRASSHREQAWLAGQIDAMVHDQPLFGDGDEGMSCRQALATTGVPVHLRDNPSQTQPAGQEVRRYLACGHLMVTAVSPGEAEWCIECDDWATVASGGPTSALPPPPPFWSDRRKQLWRVLERKAQELGIKVAKGLWTGYAPSEGKGMGKVYGGFYGQAAAGTWHSVMAYGPILGATVKDVKQFAREHEARVHCTNKETAKMTAKYRSDWPCDEAW